MTHHPSRLSEKTASLFNRCFFGIYAALFVLILFVGELIVALFGEWGDSKIPVYRVILRWLLLFVSFAAITALLVWLYRFLHSERCAYLDDRRRNTRVLLAGVGFILVLQLICAFCFKMTPIKDIAEVEEYVFRIVQENSFACIAQGHNDYYIVKYPNNLPYLFILTFIYRITYALTGTFSQVPVLIVNTLAINASILLTVLSARRMFGERKAVFTLVLCAMFSPYFTYAAFYYTDTLSMPFLMGAVYCFTAALQSESRKRKVMLLLVGGLVIGVGFELKASVAILLSAMLIWLLMERGIKRTIKTLLPILLGFIIVFTSYSAAVKASGIIPKETADRYQYPVTHWLMMGLKDMGAYNPEDSDYTMSFPSKAEKAQANLEEIQSRIEEKGFFGMIYHLGFKATWTWMDGTYYIGYYLVNYHHHTILHDFVLYDGRWRYFYYAVTSGFQLFLIFMMAYSALSAAKKRKVELTTFLRIAVFGFFLFLLMWETNNRYPFHFSPLYLLLATDGVSCFAERTPHLFKKIKRRK